MPSSLGSLVIRMAADTGTFESDMGRAARVAEQHSRAIASSATRAGRSFSNIARSLSFVNLSGLSGLTQQSKVATSALQGLGGAIMLLGVVSWPIALAVAAAGALAAFAGASKDTDKSLADLKTRLDQTADSLNKDPFKQFKKNLADANTEITKATQKLAELQQKQADLSGGGSKWLSMIPIIGPMLAGGNDVRQYLNQRGIDKAQSQLTQSYVDAARARKQLADKEAQDQKTDYDAQAKKLSDLNAQLRQQADTYGMDSVAVMKYRLETGDLSEAMHKLGAAGKVAEQSLLFTTAQIQMQKSLDMMDKMSAQLDNSGVGASLDSLKNNAAQQQAAADAARASVDKNFAKAEIFAKGETFNAADPGNSWVNDWVKAQIDALEKGDNSMSQYAKQAARDIQTAFADFLFDPFQQGLNGMLLGFVNIVKRMVAENLAAQILGGKDGKGGWLQTGMQAFSAWMGGSAKGNVFDAGGITAYANGGVVGAPTYFNSASGLGVMGEAGPEAVMPLTRDGSGRLGVRAQVDPGSATSGNVSLTTNIDARGAQDPGQMLAALQVWEAKVKKDILTWKQYGYMPA